MKFTETPLPGAFVIDIDPVEDERGFFARTFCRQEFTARGLNPDLVQCSISSNRRKGTLRGLHYQVNPREEAKVVWCIAGAIHDVIIDLRPASPTFKRWHAVELKGGTHRMVYVPEGFAHGFQTLQDDTVVFYQISVEYNPAYSRGMRYDTPGLAINWPLPITVVSERDRTFPQSFPD